MNFQNLDLNLLRVFDTVMAERNLTRAGEQLAMTQPAVSNALRRLREALGDELLTRSPGGMRPTPLAESLWPQVRDALDQIRAALGTGEAPPAQQARTYHLAMADVIAGRLVPGLVARLEALQAKARLRVLPLSTRDPRTLLELGEVDLALGYFPNAMVAITGLGDHATLRHHRLEQSEYVCVMRKGHPLSEPGALTLDAYCKAHHLLVSSSGRLQGWVDEALLTLNRKRHVVLIVNQFYTAGRVVVQSDLLTVLPASFVTETGVAGQIVTRPLPLPMPQVHVEALWHQRQEQDPGHRWLRALVLEVVAELNPA